MDFLNKIAEFMTVGLAEEPKPKVDSPIVKAGPEKSAETIVVSFDILLYVSGHK